ncbi:hypothetical protein GCM10010873_21480 [Cypionkella aquatica]|uniref:Uncharacterized protein n=1 Tax=Cypionkella aquatica TaxID=1756042 RepID=A0AA37U3S6_9RHOB|nr:hypothetical protein [Cypionkella aquatica]GLS87174.1 hypothetical protein GCM10010873_21480 [Cypionkella aquatica]
MGLISSLAAPSAPQFQSLTQKPLTRQLPASEIGNHGAALQDAAQISGAAELPAEAVLRPVQAPAASEAIFKGLLPVHASLAEVVRASDADTSLIPRMREVDGISLDGIPYFNDGAVLLDDLPQAEPEPSATPKAVAPPPDAPAELTVQPPAQPIEAETTPAPAHLLSDQAERAYQDERDISALRPEPPAEPPEAAPPAPQAKPVADDATALDKRS